MLLVDSRVGSVELIPYLQKLGLKTDKTELPFGDVAFEGNGPKGKVTVGVERKTLHDMLHCIDDARFAGHQLPGMKEMYDRCFLIIEGQWRPHDGNGMLMEGFNGGSSWGQCRYRSQPVMYAKLYRFLISVALSGVVVVYGRDLFHTAYNIGEIYHYFQKRWADHTSLLEVQKLNIPGMLEKATLTRKWAADLPGIGVKHSLAAERLFRKPITLATADETQWMKIVGVKTAQQIVREIWGNR